MLSVGEGAGYCRPTRGLRPPRAERIEEDNDLEEINSVSDKSFAETVQQLLDSWGPLFATKNAAYGDSWSTSGRVLSSLLPKGVVLREEQDFIVYGLLVRMLDKIIRVTNLQFGGASDNVLEASADTAADLGVYAAMLSAALR